MARGLADKKQKATAKTAWEVFAREQGVPEVITGPSVNAIIQPAVVTAPEPLHDLDLRDLSDEEWQALPSVPAATPMQTRKQKTMQHRMLQEQIKMQKALSQGINVTPVSAGVTLTNMQPLQCHACQHSHFTATDSTTIYCS